MKLSPENIRRLEDFFTRIQSETYPEPPSQLHTDLILDLVPKALEYFGTPPGAKVLDVGCGQGQAMLMFIERGLKPIGITVNQADIDACRDRGLDVRNMDQSFLDFEDGTFDLVWCRHCLEHSVIPLFTLQEMMRVLKPGGGLYIEVPAPDTSAAHQTNKNHYSVFGHSAWLELIRRTPGTYEGALHNIDINLKAGGTDRYFIFLNRKSR